MTAKEKSKLRVNRKPYKKSPANPIINAKKYFNDSKPIKKNREQFSKNLNKIKKKTIENFIFGNDTETQSKWSKAYNELWGLTVFGGIVVILVCIFMFPLGVLPGLLGLALWGVFLLIPAIISYFVKKIVAYVANFSLDELWNQIKTFFADITNKYFTEEKLNKTWTFITETFQKGVAWTLNALIIATLWIFGNLFKVFQFIFCFPFAPWMIFYSAMKELGAENLWFFGWRGGTAFFNSIGEKICNGEITEYLPKLIDAFKFVFKTYVKDPLGTVTIFFLRIFKTIVGAVISMFDGVLSACGYSLQIDFPTALIQMIAWPTGLIGGMCPEGIPGIDFEVTKGSILPETDFKIKIPKIGAIPAWNIDLGRVTIPPQTLSLAGDDQGGMLFRFAQVFGGDEEDDFCYDYLQCKAPKEDGDGYTATYWKDKSLPATGANLKDWNTHGLKNQAAKTQACNHYVAMKSVPRGITLNLGRDLLGGTDGLLCSAIQDSRDGMNEFRKELKTKECKIRKWKGGILEEDVPASRIKVKGGGTLKKGASVKAIYQGMPNSLAPPVYDPNSSDPYVESETTDIWASGIITGGGNNGNGWKVLYFGLPAWLCNDPKGVGTNAFGDTQDSDGNPVEIHIAPGSKLEELQTAADAEDLTAISGFETPDEGMDDDDPARAEVDFSKIDIPEPSTAPVDDDIPDYVDEGFRPKGKGRHMRIQARVSPGFQREHDKRFKFTQKRVNK